MAAAAVLDFWNLKLLMVGRLKRAELQCRAKFGRNRSHRSRDTALFRFFQDSSHPPSWICCVCVRATHKGQLVVFITVQNLEVWLENAYSRPQNWGFGGFYPLNGEQCQQNPERHIIARVRVIWVIMHKNPSTHLTCRWIPKRGINKKNSVIFYPFAQKPPVHGCAPNLARL